MQKFLIAAATFVISAALGLGLLILVTVIIGFIHVERYRAAGIGAVAGAIPAAGVFIIPVACGLLGSGYVLYRLHCADRSRKEP